MPRIWTTLWLGILASRGYCAEFSPGQGSNACYLEPWDHLPSNLAKVFTNPTKFLEGPKGEKKSDEKHFLIVGGGIAGLTSAYLLLQVGHKVTLLESSRRIGGRIFTHYGPGYYGDLGAMRFPPSHTLVHAVLNNLGIPVTRFTHDYNTKESYLYVGGKYYSAEDLGLVEDGSETKSFDEQKLMELYKLFDVKDPPKTKNGKLEHIWTLLNDIDQDVTMEDMCLNDRTYAAFLREGLVKRGADPNLMNLWATVMCVRPLLGHSLQEFLIDSVQREQKLAVKAHKHFVEIVNGTSVLTDTIFSKLQQFPNFQFKIGSKVVKVADDNKTIAVTISETNKNQKKIITGDYVIMTPTARSVSLMEFDPPLPFMKKFSIDRLNYFGSVKIFLKFSKPWWAFENKLPIIKYGDMTTTNGGSGFSDDILRATYYPSNDLHGPSLLASYTWDHDSEVFSSMSDLDCIKTALDVLEERHGSVVRETYETGVVKKWQEDNHAHGAFVIQNAFQRVDLMEHLLSPHGRVMFSAEYANKLHNGWVEAAMESAIRNLVKLWPQQFQENFGEAEKEFFKSADKNEGNGNHNNTAHG